MTFHLERTPDNPEKAALLYGPVVLAGKKGTANMSSPAPFSDPSKYNDYYTYDYHVPAGLKTTLKIDSRHPERNIKRIGQTLTFKTTDGETLIPLYDAHHERYVVYWDLKESGR